MPPGHVAATWAVASLLQKNHIRLAQLDYRLLALSALGPDLLDKPLAIFLFTESHSSQNVGHSLTFHVVLLFLALLWWRKALPYILAVNGHLVADRMWYHTETFWWPVYGWDVFWHYKPMNTPGEMLNVYLDIITRYPQVWVIEIIAIGWLLQLLFNKRLYRRPVFKSFLRSGWIVDYESGQPTQKTKNPLRSIQKHV
jgi:hypothetical protein